MEIEVTQADREAADLAFNVWDNTNELALAFARHRQAAIKERDAEIERLRGALANIGNLSLNGCIKVNTPHGLWVGTPDAYAREVLGMPWRTEDPDYSNEVMGGWND